MAPRRKVAKETFFSDDPAIMELWERTKTISNQINSKNTEADQIKSDLDNKIDHIHSLKELRLAYLRLLEEYGGAGESIHTLDEVAISTNFSDETARARVRVVNNYQIQEVLSAADLASSLAGVAKAVDEVPTKD